MTHNHKYSKTPSSDTFEDSNLPNTSLLATGNQISLHLTCLTAMPQFVNKSIEELRFEDYSVLPFSSTVSIMHSNIAKNATIVDKNSNLSSQHVRAETCGDEPRHLKEEDFSSCPICLKSLLKVKQILLQYFL
jgi:hypothetical protein